MCYSKSKSSYFTSLHDEVCKWLILPPHLLSPVAHFKLFDFAAKQIEKPPWYKAMGGGIEAQAMELFVQRRQIQAQREELRKWISASLGPSAWQELLKIEAEVRKAQREHEYKRIEIRQKIIEWTAGILLFVICVGALFVLVWLMRTANG